MHACPRACMYSFQASRKCTKWVDSGLVENTAVSYTRVNFSSERFVYRHCR
jgi:hypothetical protein